MSSFTFKMMFALNGTVGAFCAGMAVYLWDQPSPVGTLLCGMLALANYVMCALYMAADK